jgi:hypothetical protein
VPLTPYPNIKKGVSLLDSLLVFAVIIKPTRIWREGLERKGLEEGGIEEERLERDGLKGFVYPIISETFTFHSPACSCIVELRQAAEMKIPKTGHLTLSKRSKSD